jgi:Carboxypeptidase regulatory-like domain
VLAFALSLALASGALGAETGRIAGTVTDASTKAAIEGIEVCASAASETSFEFECATTNSSGQYTISGLASGEYNVEFAAPFESGLDYVTQYYNDKSSFSEASTVLVAAPGTTSGIDAKLQEGGRITGKVTNAATKAAIAGIEVCAFAMSIEVGECAKTKAEGEYTVSGLASGEYTVEFTDPFEGGLNYITQYYEDKTSSSGANRVSVTAPDTTSGIDAELKEGGQITGRVTDAPTHAAIEGALVCAREAGGGNSVGGCAVTNSNGEYIISGLPSGEYKVGFTNGRKYVNQYYSGEASLSAANAVSVTAGSITAGIDAAMQPVIVSAPPVDATPPAVSGTAVVGSTLACANGLWTGNPAPTFTYRWLRDGTPIPGASESAYKVQSADAGHGLSCEVTAKNGAGEKSIASASVAIPGTSVVDLVPPHPVVTITGTKIVVSRGSVSVHVKCSQATCRGSIELTVQVIVKRPLERRRSVLRRETIVLAKGSFSLAAGKSATVTLRLTATGRKRLAHAKRHPIAAKLILAVKGEATTTRSVLAR